MDVENASMNAAKSRTVWQSIENKHEKKFNPRVQQTNQ